MERPRSKKSAQAPVSVTGYREKPLPFTVAGTRPPTNTSPISCVPIAALENSVTETQWPPLIVRFSRQLFHPTLSPILQSNQLIVTYVMIVKAPELCQRVPEVPHIVLIITAILSGVYRT